MLVAGPRFLPRDPKKEGSSSGGGGGRSGGGGGAAIEFPPTARCFLRILGKDLVVLLEKLVKTIQLHCQLVRFPISELVQHGKFRFKVVVILHMSNAKLGRLCIRITVGSIVVGSGKKEKLFKKGCKRWPVECSAWEVESKEYRCNK